jgi:hypothetical protein
MNAPIQQVAGAEPWAASRWTDLDVARAAEIFKREAVDRYGFGEGGRLPKGERERIITLVAATLGRPFISVANRLNNYGATFASLPTKHRAIRRTPSPTPHLAGRGAPWTSEDIGKAARIFQDDVTDHYGDKPPRGAMGEVFQKIADAVGREMQAVVSRYGNYGRTFSSDHGRESGAAKASAYQLAERDKRAAARRSQDLTASWMGDPPPGYSALDKRKSAP